MNDIDCISYEISCAANALGAVHDAMRNGDNAPEGYLDALYCVYDYLWDKQKKLRAAVDRVCEAKKGRAQ